MLCEIDLSCASRERVSPLSHWYANSFRDLKGRVLNGALRKLAFTTSRESEY